MDHHLTWIVGASARTPLAEAEIRQHMAPALVGALNPTLAALGPLTLVRRVSAAQAVVQVAGQDHLLRLQVDDQGLVDNVDLNLVEPPITWPELDDRLAALGARVSFAAAAITPSGQCEVVHGRDADLLRPIGSGFKLYVLGALAHAVAAGEAAWDEKLAIRDDWRSPFSHALENRPAGTELTLAEYADAMMWVSDNTATDHLIHRLGRDTVQRQFALFGHSQLDANNPLLTTKAFFHLKIDGAKEYLALPARNAPTTWRSWKAARRSTHGRPGPDRGTSTRSSSSRRPPTSAAPTPACSPSTSPRSGTRWRRWTKG
ncbi:hypothetical protein GCM10029964_072570 [Kibdelosporangium lantanae]